LVEAKVNTRWPLDFVYDQLIHGRRFRILNIARNVTRECLAAIPGTLISGILACLKMLLRLTSSATRRRDNHKWPRRRYLRKLRAR